MKHATSRRPIQALWMGDRELRGDVMLLERAESGSSTSLRRAPRLLDREQFSGRHHFITSQSRRGFVRMPSSISAGSERARRLPGGLSRACGLASFAGVARVAARTHARTVARRRPAPPCAPLRGPIGRQEMEHPSSGPRSCVQSPRRFSFSLGAGPILACGRRRSATCSSFSSQ
jgi:hypothetical protein